MFADDGTKVVKLDDVTIRHKKRRDQDDFGTSCDCFSGEMRAASSNVLHPNVMPCVPRVKSTADTLWCFRTMCLSPAASNPLNQCTKARLPF